VDQETSCVAVVKNFMLMAERSFALNPFAKGSTHTHAHISCT